MQIYVSNAGSDTNNGKSSGTPVKTIAKATSLLDKTGKNAIYLARGSTFTSPLPTPVTDLTVMSFGDTGPLPVVSTAKEAINAVRRANIAISGIAFRASLPTTTAGLRFVWCKNINISGCEVTGYSSGVTCEGDTTRSANFAVTGCHIHDNYSQTSTHSEGIFCSNTDGITLTNNLLDHNGWSETDPKGKATIFNHNCYIQVSNTNLVATGNVFANASSHGLQARCGGTIRNNLFHVNAIGMSFGLVNGDDDHVPGGVSGGIGGNVFYGNKDIAGAARGTGIELGNIKSAALVNNLFLHDMQHGVHGAIEVSAGDSKGDVGILDLTLTGNVIFDWAKGVWINPALKSPHVVQQASYAPVSGSSAQEQQTCKCCGHVSTVTVSTDGADTAYTLPADYLDRMRQAITDDCNGASACALYLRAFAMTA